MSQNGWLKIRSVEVFLCSVEEEKRSNEILFLKTKLIDNTKYARSDVMAVARCYKIYENGQLVVWVKMQNSDVALTDYLYAVFDLD